MTDVNMWNRDTESSRWLNLPTRARALAETGVEPTADEAIAELWEVIAECWPGFRLDADPDRHITVDYRGFDPAGYIASAWIVKDIEQAA